MANLTLAGARAALLEFLDDDGTRWPVASQDRALGWALSQCQTDYAAAGGDRFNILTEFTSTSAGIIDMTSVKPLAIREVTLRIGVRFWPLIELPMPQREFDDIVARFVQVRFVPEFFLPTDVSHPLVGTGGAGANSWLGFDNWVCARAALYAMTKDAEVRPELSQLEADMRDGIMVMPKIPKQVPFPKKVRGYTGIVGYAFRQDTQDLVLVRKSVWA